MGMIFKNELKKVFKRNYVIAFVFIVLVLQLFLQVGRLSQLNNIENRNSLQKVERAKVSSYEYFRQFSTQGITLMFVPSLFGILYNDSSYELLFSNVNMSFSFNIYPPLWGKELFTNNSPFLNFMGVSLLLIFYFGVFYGKDTTIKTDYLKTLSSLYSKRKTLLIIMFFRLLILVVSVLLMMVINLIVLLISNINLFQASLLQFFWGLILVTFFSYGIGCFLGTVKGSSRRNIAFFVIYVVSVLLLALVLNFFTKINASDIQPVSEFDFENLAVVMNEESFLAKKYPVLPLNESPSNDLKRDARQSIFNESEKISKNLDLLKSQLESKIKARKFVAALFPTLFYFSICEDASSNSYDRFIEFFDFTKDKKEKFVLFCVDRIYPLPIPEKNETPAPGQQGPGVNPQVQEGQGFQISHPKQPIQPKIENFIKGDEGLFFAESKLPRYFWLGSILSLLWVAGFFFASYRRSLKQLLDEPGELSDFEVEMKSDSFNYLMTADQGLKNQVNNSLTGEGISYVNITIDGNPLEHTGFIYVYDTEKFLKDIDQKFFYTELFGQSMPGSLKPCQFLADYAARSKKILLLDNFFNGMEVDEIDDFIETVKRLNVIALYIGGEFFQACYLDVELLFCTSDLSIPSIAEKVKAINKRRAKNSKGFQI